MKAPAYRILGWLLVAMAGAGFASAACPNVPHLTGLAGYALSPDASRLAAIAEDGTLFWWDVASGKRTQLTECLNHGTFDQPILFSPDSSQLAVVAGRAIEVFDVSTGEVTARLTNPKLNSIESMTFSGDGRRLAARYDEGVIVWSLAGQTEIMSVTARTYRYGLALSHAGNILAIDGRGGITLWNLEKNTIERTIPLAERAGAEAIAFAHGDRWLVAAIAIALPVKPKQRFVKSKRILRVWDLTTGAQLKTLSGLTQEMRFAPTIVEPDTLQSVEYDFLRFWNLESGKLAKTWETPAGHPSADGKFLLREGDAPGKLELWEIGAPEGKAQSFVYRSPLCAEGITGPGDKEETFDLLFFADGRNEDDGHFSTRGYVARDCTRVNVTWSAFKSANSAKRHLERRTAQAARVIERGPPEDFWEQVFLGDRVVVRFAGRRSATGAIAVMWVEGKLFLEISSSSLAVALAMERLGLRERFKK